MEAPSSTSCTLSSSPASTTIVPSERVPDSTYTPAALIVITPSSICTSELEQVAVFSDRVIFTASLSSYVPARSRFVNISVTSISASLIASSMTACISSTVISVFVLVVDAFAASVLSLSTSASVSVLTALVTSVPEAALSLPAL